MDRDESRVRDFKEFKASKKLRTKEGRQQEGFEKEEVVLDAKQPTKQPSEKLQRAPESSEFVEKVITIKRVTKVTKGGKKLSFSALVVVGDTKGRVGYSLGKAGEVAIAIKKALLLAKKSMVKIPLKGTTIPHEITGHFGAATVLLKPASEGTGVIAGGSVRAICEAAGIKDILTKSLGSNNAINVLRATEHALQQFKLAHTSPPAQELASASTDSDKENAS